MIFKQYFKKYFLQRKKRLHEAQQLFEVLYKEWNFIDQRTINKWIEEMLRRLHAILNANRGYT